MSSLLTWHHGATQTPQSGSTQAAIIDDIVAMFAQNAANPDFLWEVCDSDNVGPTPMFVNLRRKDLSAGRILILQYPTTPGGGTWHPTIFQVAPQSNSIYMCYFPAGNVSTPSNLAGVSGTIMGDDTGAIKVSSILAYTTWYQANYVMSYFDSEAGVYILCGNPGGVTTYAMGAGELLVDAADNAYSAVFGTGTAMSWANMGNKGSGMGWFGPSTAFNAGNVNAGFFRTNYGATDRIFFTGMFPNNFGYVTDPGSEDILADTGINRAWFIPHVLTGRTKGIGFPLKIRQLAFGPPVVGPFSIYEETIGVTKAINGNQMTTPNGNQQSSPWFLNFKI